MERESKRVSDSVFFLFIRTWWPLWFFPNFRFCWANRSVPRGNVATCPARGVRTQRLPLANRPLAGTRGAMALEEGGPSPSSLPTLVLKVTGFKRTW